MRLHRLELTAFGPFAGTAAVDFDTLGADGLFLLHGDTGSGKTSLLDAVAYALFGRVPGARQQANRLRCDHADPATAPRVSLDLTIGGRRVRVARWLEWQRPKLRGEGTTREPAKALLEERRGGAWHPVSTRVDEASDQLQAWLGMSAEQFFQVVLLPQGEFARFLRADSADREQLLERLFGTRRFSEVEAWLAGRRREARAEVAAVEERLRGVLARLCQAAGVEDEPALADADATWRGSLVAGAGRAAAAAAVTAEEATAALRAAEAEFERVATVRRRQERKRLADSERAAVEAGRPDQSRRLSRVEAARRAAAVRPLLRSWRAAAAAAAGAALAADRAAGVLRGSAPGEAAGAALGGAALSDVDQLRRWSAELRDELSRLAALRQDAEELPRVAAALRELAERRAAVAAEAELRAARLEALPAEIEAQRKEVAGGERARERIGPLAGQAERVRAALTAAREHTAGEVAVASLRQRVLVAVDAHQQARDRVQELRQRRLDGIAAELAEGLGAGAACPVCGGVEHPAPARPRSGRRVTEAMEASAAAEEEARRGDREAAEGELARVERDQARLAALAGGRLEVDLGVELASCSAALADATAAAAGLDAARHELARLEAEEREHTEAARAAALESGALDADCAQLESKAAALTAKLDAARGTDPSLPARLDRLAGLAERVDALTEALRVAADRRAAAGAALEVVRAESARARFADPEAAERACLDDAELAALEAACQEFDRRDAATGAAMDDPEFAGLDEQPPAETGPAGDELAAARAEHAARVAEARRRDAAQAEVTRLAAILDRAAADAEPVRRRAEQIVALADLVAGQGQNARRMTLRAYVLAARLDEVARSASVRLRRMSGGRYSFLCTPDGDNRRVRAGLGLQILDDYSGHARSTKTLSGGESFMASLALALGLADVVAAEAGGIPLETLFIDEGFGGLDADTLDLVMDTLEDLRAGGRVIGLVSHVEEMRQRIPMRLRVHKVGARSVLRLDCAP